nr:hypothetical protein JVH1_4274 [Rhodococcus sp. JVH1]
MRLGLRTDVVSHRSNAAVGHGREGLTAGLSSAANPWRRPPTRR